MTRLLVEICPVANTEHERSGRQYAHVFCRRDKICVSSAFGDLPETHKLGILLHEVGHVLAGQRASEKRSNETILKASGIRVRYRDSRYGSRLEWIRTKDKADAEEFLGLK